MILACAIRHTEGIGVLVSIKVGYNDVVISIDKVQIFRI